LGDGGVSGNLGRATNAASNLVFDGGTLSYTGATASTNRSFTITTGKTATWEVTANNLTLTGASAVTTGSLTKTGAGTLTLGAAQGHTGTTTVNAGTLAYGVNNALSTGAVIVDGASAVLSLGGFSDSISSLTLVNGGSLSTGGGTLTSTTDYDLRSGSSSGGLTGAVALTKSSNGSVSITGANAYTGATLITAGILEVTANNALGTTAAGTTVQSGAAFKLNSAAYTSAEALALNGSGIGGGGAFVNSGTSSYAGQITAATNAMIHAGGGALTLTGGLVKNGTTLTLTGGGSITVSGTGISGASANSDLVVAGTTVNLNAANTYNGPTFIRDGGVLNANVSSALPTTPRSAMILDDVGTGSSTLALTASNSAASLSGAASSTITLATGSTLTAGSSSGSSTFAGTVSGAGALVKDGSSTQTLTGASTYSGGTSVTGGILVVNNNSGSATGTGSLTIDPGATLAGTGSIAPDAGNYIYLNGALVVGDPTLSSPVASALTLTTSGSGSTMLGSSSTLSLDLFASGGDLTAYAAASDRIRLFGELDATLGGSVFLGNPNLLTFSYGDRWKIFQVTGPGTILADLTINATALGLSSLQVSFDRDTGILSIVPEPSRTLMLLTGILLLQLRRRRQSL
jgi:fibronectin-binding autotransporter adhesin